MSEGSPVGAHVIKMMGYIQALEKLSFPLNIELAIDRKEKERKWQSQRVLVRPNPKRKNALKTKGGISKEGKCFHCDKPGQWKRNCPVYLEDVKKAKAVGASLSGTAHEKESS
ncbi:hypothetical protein V6N13_024785 [Hibiscus sabdariffa]